MRELKETMMAIAYGRLLKKRFLKPLSFMFLVVKDSNNRDSYTDLLMLQILLFVTCAFLNFLKLNTSYKDK